MNAGFEIETFKRLFVSYSRDDSNFANTIAEDLRKSGFEVWIDFEGLIPGTPDWELAIREAIEESFALLLISTPSSRKSQYVRSEILLSEAKNLPIFAIWARGENWIDSIPMNLAYIQYLDFRSEAYTTNYPSLVKELEKLNLVIPDHFIYKSFYKKILPNHKKPEGFEKCGSVSGSISYEIYKKKSPKSYLEIKLNDKFRELEKKDCLDALFVKPNAFKMCIHLLDTIYMHYLSNRFLPYSYGKQWILTSHSWRTSQVAIDWYFNRQNTGNSKFAKWMTAPPANYGLVPDSIWNLSDRIQDYFIVLAANDEWLINSILSKPKSPYFLIPEYMEECSSEKFDETQYKKIVVITNLVFGAKEFANKIMVQTKECSDSDKERWNY